MKALDTAALALSQLILGIADLNSIDHIEEVTIHYMDTGMPTASITVEIIPVGAVAIFLHTDKIECGGPGIDGVYTHATVDSVLLSVDAYIQNEFGV